MKTATSENTRINKLRRFIGPREFLEIQYTQFYKEVKVYYSEKVVFETSGLDELSKGVMFLLPDGRNIHLQYNTSPIEFTVKINNVYAQNSFHHPKQKLKSLYNWYSFILVLSVLVFMFSALTLVPILLVLNLLVIASVALIMAGLSNGNKYMVHFGFFVFIIRTFLILAAGSTNGQLMLILLPFLVFRIVIIILTFKKMKIISEYHDYMLLIKGKLNRPEILN